MSEKKKRLSELLADVPVKHVTGDLGQEVCDVVCDSRVARAGHLFVAVHGAVVDSHRFIGDVIDRGVTAVLCQDLPEHCPQGVTIVQVEDSTRALALVADAWFDHPSRHLRLVGVTGTNGKTSVATLLYELMRLLGYKAGLLSTVQNIIDRHAEPAVQTTPDHLTLNRLLARMVEAGCDYAFMEVSSHACVQRRIDGLRFAGGVFTNLSRDHMDFHHTVDNYIAAKKRFFDLLPQGAFALTNVDDKVGEVMLQNCRATRHTYSLRSPADFTCRVLEDRLDGMLLSVDGRELEVPFTGRFNAYNLLAVYGTAVLLGHNRDEALLKMSLLRAVSGRFETLTSPRGYTAVIDYAHTPDALENVLRTLDEVVHGDGHIITVCGCGGNRDKGKRPIMAAVAARMSDRVVLTADNPRDEDPGDILDQMEQGVPAHRRDRVHRIVDRREAIAMACALAQPGDVVLIAGKGHETYQEIKGVKHHFDDHEQVRQVFDNESKNR